MSTGGGVGSPSEFISPEKLGADLGYLSDRLEDYRKEHEKLHDKEHKAHEKEHTDHVATKAWVYKKGYVIVGLVATVGAALVTGVLRLFFG